MGQWYLGEGAYCSAYTYDLRIYAGKNNPKIPEYLGYLPLSRASTGIIR